MNDEGTSTRVSPGALGPLGLAIALFAPAVVVRLIAVEPAPILAVLLYGAGFVGAALLLTWGTELAQLDLPRGLAVAILALIAILPEYAVDLLFAYQAGNDPSKAPLALANMTGANRLLIGVGWSAVVLVAALGALRRRKSSGASGTEDQNAGMGVALSSLSAVDVAVLGAVSLYTLTFVLRSSLTLIDTAVLFTVFGFYVYRLSTAPQEKPDFLGPPAQIAKLRTGLRRSITVAFMLAGGVVILLLAEPFSSSLVDAGDQMGVSKFLMVQWVAPLATESAELIPAALFAWRQKGDDGLSTLLSAKINQWTLLVGAVPLAFALSSSSVNGLPIDAVQSQELFLTAAQSVFAVSLLVDLRLSVKEAGLLLTLFLIDFGGSVLLPEDHRVVLRLGFAALYLALAVVRLVRVRRELPRTARHGFLTPTEELAGRTANARSQQDRNTAFVTGACTKTVVD